jgi:hypothetical protein
MHAACAPGAAHLSQSTSCGCVPDIIAAMSLSSCCCCCCCYSLTDQMAVLLLAQQLLPRFNYNFSRRSNDCSAIDLGCLGPTPLLKPPHSSAAVTLNEPLPRAPQPSKTQSVMKAHTAGVLPGWHQQACCLLAPPARAGAGVVAPRQRQHQQHQQHQQQQRCTSTDVPTYSRPQQAHGILTTTPVSRRYDWAQCHPGSDAFFRLAHPSAHSSLPQGCLCWHPASGGGMCRSSKPSTGGTAAAGELQLTKQSRSPAATPTRVQRCSRCAAAGSSTAAAAGVLAAARGPSTAAAVRYVLSHVT